jgi:UDP-glucose 4-epimerase
MTTTAHDWVIGRGLLGAAIVKATAPHHVHRASIRWADDQLAAGDLADAARQFYSTSGPRRIYWTAGRGVTSTSEADLHREVAVFRGFLDQLSAEDSARTTIFLASSVGGAYGGSPHPPFTELTPAVPASAYGRAKMGMEGATSDWARRTGGRAFIARITNIYGPGQDMSKAQGLISTILRSYLVGAPTTIYVSLDTLRDYVFVDDCARIAIAGTRRAAAGPRGEATMKIVGFGTAVSIGAVLGEARRLRRSTAPIIVGQGNAAGQASDLRVRSRVWTDLDALARTTLPAGIGATFQAMLQDRTVGWPIR